MTRVCWGEPPGLRPLAHAAARAGTHASLRPRNGARIGAQAACNPHARIYTTKHTHAPPAGAAGGGAEYAGLEAGRGAGRGLVARPRDRPMVSVCCAAFWGVVTTTEQSTCMYVWLQHVRGIPGQDAPSLARSFLAEEAVATLPAVGPSEDARHPLPPPAPSPSSPSFSRTV